MSRPLRIVYPNAWYHVMNRGRRQEDTFLDEGDYRLFLDVLSETVKMWNLQVAAYCLMPNHYHLLVHTPDGNISRCMRHLNGVYTQRFNRKHGIDGPLFRGRYKTVLVEEDNHLLELLRYIHRNPIKAGIADNLDNYPWCSHKGYIAGTRGWSWLHREPLLKMFSHNRKQAFLAYLDFVMQQDSEQVEFFYAKQKLSPIFGSTSFIQSIKNFFQPLTQEKEIPETIVLRAKFPDIVKAVCTICEVPEETIFQSRRGQKNLARDLVIYSMRQHSGLTLCQIGSFLGIEGYSSVSSTVQRVKKVLANNKKMRKAVVEINEELVKAKTRLDP